MAKKGPKAITFTTQEMAISFWCISLIFALVMIDQTNMGATWIFFMFMILFFSFLSVAWLCYLFSKYTLNAFTDRIHHDYETWIRCDKTGMFTLQIVKKGSLGLSKGVAHGVKAAIINRGDTNYSLPNGNRVLLKFDALSHNINLDEAIGWQLIHKKWELLGYNAYEKAEADRKTLIKIEGKEDTAVGG